MERLVLTLLLVTVVSSATVDKTRVAKEKGAAVVEAVTEVIQESCIFPDDALLLRRIAYAESRDGEDTSAFSNGTHDYYGGIWRVNEDMFSDTQVDTTHFADINSTFDIEWSSVTWQDLWKPLYSGLAARLYIEAAFTSIPRSEEDQATKWVLEYRNLAQSDSALITQYLNAANMTVKECSIPSADIVFVLDGSGSITAPNYVLVQEFVASVVRSFEISQSKVRIGLMKYSNEASVEFDLDEYSDVDDVVAAVRAAPYPGGSTQSDKALLLMEDMFDRKGRGNESVPLIGVFLTDGQSTNPSATIAAANQVHQGQVTVFSVGITSGVNMQELEVIGTDPDCIHVYYLETFDDVLHFARQIEAQACKAPAELEENKPVYGEVVTEETYYCKMPVKKEDDGCTVQTDVQSGVVDIYLSWTTRNPGPALYDFYFNVDNSKSIYVPWDDDYEGGEIRELYATIVGMDTLNAFSLQYNGGWLDSGSKHLTSAGSMTLVLMATLVKTFMM